MRWDRTLATGTRTHSRRVAPLDFPPNSMHRSPRTLHLIASLLTAIAGPYAGAGEVGAPAGPHTLRFAARNLWEAPASGRLEG